MGKISLQDFYKKLVYHDWHYEYSDDYSVVCEGRESSIKLNSLADTSPEHRELHTKYRNYAHLGKPKPACPE